MRVCIITSKSVGTNLSESVKLIPLSKIRPSKLNPRLDFNVERLNELSASIREIGLLEPIVVRPRSDEFEVVVGERRYRACLQAGIEEALAIVRNYTDEQVIQMNLIENIHREDLSALEKGAVCKQLMDTYPDKYPSIAGLAKKIGVTEATISLWLKAVEVIPEEAKQFIAASTISGDVPNGKVDYQTAIRVGRSIKEPERQLEVIRNLAKEKPSVKVRNRIIENAANEPQKPIEQIFKEENKTSIEVFFSAQDLLPIVSGAKTQSSRTIPPDPRIKPEVIVQATVFEPHFADLRIISIERKRLKYFDEEDAKREGGFTLSEFKKHWQDLNRDWDEDQFVYVIHFDRIG
jgi:ParB family chromosome partitioning protein